MADDKLVFSVIVSCPASGTSRTIQLVSTATLVRNISDHECDIEKLEAATTSSGLAEPSKGDAAWWVISPELYYTAVGELFSPGGNRYLKCFCEEKEKESSSSLPTSTPVRNALDVLRKGAQDYYTTRNVLPLKRALEQSGVDQSSADVRKKLDSKDNLYNDLIDVLEYREVGFGSEAEGKYVTQNLTSALWYITNQHQVIRDASFHNSCVTPVGAIWDEFQGYFDHKRRKVKEQQMSQSNLSHHGQNLKALCLRPSLDSSPENRSFRDEIEKLAECMTGYATYLQQKLEQTKASMNATHCHRQIETDVYVSDRKRALQLHPEYETLNAALQQAELWEPVFFDETNMLKEPFKNYMQRQRFFANLQLTMAISVLKYCPGGSKTTVMYIWRTQDLASSDSLLTHTARICDKLRPLLPVYHTRQMKKDFKDRYAHLTSLGSSVMETIYRDLTGDASAHPNRLMQQRIQLAQECPGIITDLRHLNEGRPGDRFDMFWSKMEGVINEVTAADERRHGVAHLAKWISLEDLIQQVEKLCPEGTPIPSKSCVRLQFAPRNPYTHRAMQFTSRFKVQYKIQVRQLRAAHPDSHFCAALFKYFRQRALQLKDHVQMYCMDDKAKVHLGEPGNPVSTGVRGRASIAPTNTTLSALDHDVNTKSAVTSSVLLKPNIPDRLENSWYQGSVTVYVGDAVFEQANAYRSVAMMVHSANKAGSKPLLYRYTDGGAENRNNLTKVQLALIAAFLMLDLDMLVAARCAPGQSWQNPAERVMAILNIALQNCATERAPCTEPVEKILKNCGSMAAIREKGKDNDDLKQEWKESVGEVIDTISSRYKRLSLKGEQFDVNPPVGTHLIDEVKSTVQTKFQVDPDNITKLQATRNKELADWMSKHCRERHYCFQVAKCTDEGCCKKAKLPQDHRMWLPDPVLSGDHYLNLDDVIGKATTDEDRPSTKPKHKAKSTSVMTDYFIIDEIDEQRKSTSLFTAQNARGIVQCVECDKQRVWYAKLQLSSREKTVLATEMSKYDYTCGSPLLPPNHSLAKKIQVRLALSCGDLVELAYYKIGRLDTCCHCGGAGGVKDPEEVKMYRTVLPMCDACKAKGKASFHSRELAKRKT